MCFFRDVWSSISKSSHCFILPNGFPNLLWLNLIVAVHVSSKWAYTDFVSCVQLVKEQQPAILPARLQKSSLILTNMESASAMEFLNSLGLDAWWGHTVKRTMSMRNFLCPLQTYLLPESYLPHEGKGVFVIWCTSLPHCWRAAAAVWGVSLLHLPVCSTHIGQGDVLRRCRPHLVAPSDVPWAHVLFTCHRNGCKNTQHSSSNPICVHFCEQTRTGTLTQVWSGCMDDFRLLSASFSCFLLKGSVMEWSIKKKKKNRNPELSFVSTSKFKCFWSFRLHQVFREQYRDLC